MYELNTVSSPTWEIVLPVLSICEWGDRGVTDADGGVQDRLVRLTSTISWYWINGGEVYSVSRMLRVPSTLYTRQFLYIPTMSY